MANTPSCARFRCHPILYLHLAKARSLTLSLLSRRLGAAVLSHHVDDFALVSAFFLFSLGCVNILLGLIFRESAKWRRSVTSWREQDKNTKGGVLPTSQVPRPLVMAGTGSSAPWDKEREAYGYGGGADASRSGSLLSQKSGLGFGRQGEKGALSRGTCPLFFIVYNLD